jgi:hypothetical protein
MALMANWYTYSHSTGLVDPSYLSIADGLKLGGQITMSSRLQVTSSRLVVVGAMRVIILLITVLMLGPVVVLPMILYPTMCVLGADDISEVPFALTPIVSQPRG